MSSRTAMETIQAAIEKLEALKALPWPCADWTQNAVRHIARNCEIECYDDSHEDELTWDRYETGPAIFLLSQTIDAQLAILRHAIENQEIAHGWVTVDNDAVVLAESILGEQS